MARRRKKSTERPMINLILILFLGLALYDSGNMAVRSFADELPRAIAASAYCSGALISFTGLLLNRRTLWLWLLITALLGTGLAYLISIQAVTWIIGLAVMLFFWLKSNNRRWHRIRF